jgi:plasmid stabilization system protein ParE
MPRIKLTALAQHDLLRLYRFLADKNASIAVRAIDAIQADFIPLATMPNIGRPVQDGLRELIIDFGNTGYAALYYVDELLDEVVVLAVKHQLEDDYTAGI